MATGLWLKLDHAQTSTSVTLSDGTGLIGSPAFVVTKADVGVAAPVASGLSGRGTYAPVVCDITVSVLASTADGIWSALETLYKLFSLASIWASGKQGVSPVLLRFSPPGSTTTGITTSTDLTAVVLRPINGGVDVDMAEPMRSSAAGGYQLDNVRLRFERQGEWCYVFTPGSAVERVTGSAAATNATVQTLAFSAATPQHVKMPAAAALVIGSSTNSINGIIKISSNANSIQIANVTYTGGNFATVADGKLPRSGTNAIRFTPTDTSVNTMGSGMSVSSVDRPIFVLSVRNNSAGGHQYRVRIRIDDAGTPYTYTAWKVLDDSNTNCRHIVFPAVGLLYGKVYTAKIEVAASATGSTMDFNTISHVDSAEYSSQLFRFGTAFGRAVVRSPLLADDRNMAAFEGSYTNEYDVTARTANARALPMLSGTPPFISSDTVYMLALIHSAGYWAQRTSLNALETIQYILDRRRITVAPR